MKEQDICDALINPPYVQNAWRPFMTDGIKAGSVPKVRHNETGEVRDMFEREAEPATEFECDL